MNKELMDAIRETDKRMIDLMGTGLMNKDKKWNNPTPVVVCMAQADQDYLIAVRRNIQPKLGELALPGGFVDEGETIEAAAVREFREETGIDTHPLQWMLRHSYITEQNRVLIFAECGVIFPESVIEGFTPNAEVQELVLVEPGDKLCWESHQEALDNFDFE